MRAFAMCSSCAAEYRDPLSRRFHAQPIGPAHRQLGLYIEFHNADVDALLQPAGDPPDRTRLAIEIDETHVALGGAVEFQQLLDVESRLEFFPYLAAQTVADAKTQLVGAIGRRDRLVQQIAAQLADVEENR